MPDILIAVVYHSKYGHTKLQAEAVRDGVLEVPNTQVLLLDVTEAQARLDELDRCHGIILGAPTYMGNMSSGMKGFLEAAVGKWFKQVWQDKIAGGFTNSSNFSGDKQNTLTGLFTFAMQMGMIWVGVGELVASNEPGAEDTLTGPSAAAVNRNSASVGPMACSFQVKAPDAPGAGDLLTARNYGRRVAEKTWEFTRGHK